MQPFGGDTVLPFGLINLGVLPLLLEALVPGYAQGDPREQAVKHAQLEQEARSGPQEPLARVAHAAYFS